MLTLFLLAPIVKAAENSGTALPPHTCAASMPATVAPAVFAMVLRIRIAEVGFETSRFRSNMCSAATTWCPSFFAASRMATRVE